MASAISQATILLRCYLQEEIPERDHFFLGGIQRKLCESFHCYAIISYTWICMTDLIFMNSYDRITFCICHRFVCGFITGSCYSLSFPISPLWKRMTWKQKILMGLFNFHLSMQIGKISFVTWTRGCKPTTTSVMKDFRSLDWFGWVNVWWPNFRNFCHSCVIGVWFIHWDI